MPFIDPLCVRLIEQRHEGDCSIACLAMLLNRSYGDVSQIVRAIVPTVHRTGAYNGHVIKAAAALGAVLRRVRTFDLHDSSGLLNIDYPTGHDPSAHFVVLFAGVILDPTWGTVMPVDDYLAAEATRIGAKPTVLLRLWQPATG